LLGEWEGCSYTPKILLTIQNYLTRSSEIWCLLPFNFDACNFPINCDSFVLIFLFWFSESKERVCYLKPQNKCFVDWYFHLFFFFQCSICDSQFNCYGIYLFWESYSWSIFTIHLRCLQDIKYYLGFFFKICYFL